VAPIDNLPDLLKGHLTKHDVSVVHFEAGLQVHRQQRSVTEGAGRSNRYSVIDEDDELFLVPPSNSKGTFADTIGKAQILISPVEAKNDLGNSDRLTAATVFRTN
jgi:hypothetical protein